MIAATTRWIPDNFSRVQKASLGNVSTHIVLRIDRSMLRTNASTFSDIKKYEDTSNFQNLTMQLFMEMIHRLDMSVKENPDLVHFYPFLKVYLEWVPSANNNERACEYRVHVFFTKIDEQEGVDCGKTLSDLLFANDNCAREASESIAGSRKPDVLQNLKPHQMWRRITKELYLRVICGLVRGDSTISNNLDQFLSHGNPLSSSANLAHPANVFTLEHCLRHTKNRYPNVNKKFYSVKEYRLNGVYNFPDYDKVWRLTPGQIAVHSFIRKYVPDFQAFNDKRNPPPARKHDIPEPVEDEDTGVEQHVDAAPMIPLLAADKPASPETRFDAAQMGEYDMRDSATLEEERINAFTTRGDFHVMYDEARRYYVDIVAPLEGTEQWRAQYDEYQKWCISQTVARCFSPDSNVSPMIQRICRWGETRQQVDCRYTPVDPTLSAFANRVIRMLEQFEQFNLVSTAHLHYYLFLHARYDAYRRAMDKVKMNCFIFGEGAAGKSFLFKEVQKDSIPGTTVELTYQTGKADAIDGNRNGEITIMHEVPPTMFRSKAMGRTADKSEESRWKDKLTRQKVTVKTFYIDEETGKRGNRTAESECGGVWFGACNQTADDIEEALATRFLKVTCETTLRPDKDISDCQNAERKMDPDTKDERKFIRAQRREEQYRMCIIEHLIWMGAIKDVDESAYHVTIGQFKENVRKMREDFNPRDFERVRIFSRVQAIVTALDIVYNLPGGELYGQPFREEDLPILEPYLVITEEMVLFSLSLMSYMFVSSTEHKVFHAVYRMYSWAPGITGSTADTKNREYLSKDGHQNHNYLNLGNFNSIVGEIHRKLPLRDGRVPEEEIRALLISLKKRHISSRDYKRSDDPSDKIPREVTTGRPHSNPVAVFTKEGVHIHQKYIEQFKHKHKDPVRDIIENMSHKYARSKRMLIARPVTDSYHILRTFNREPNDKIIMERNVLYNNDASRAILGLRTVPACRQQKKHVYNNDLDDEAYQKRCNILRVDVIDPMAVMERIHNHGEATISYPADLVEGGIPTSPVEHIPEAPVNRLIAPMPTTAPEAPAKTFSQTTIVAQQEHPEQGMRAYHKRKAAEELATPSKRARHDPIQPGANAVEGR